MSGLRAGCLLVVLGTLVGGTGPILSAAAPADDAPRLRFTRVRGLGDELRRLIREADARSSTFRSLVDEIGSSNAVVLVELGFCGEGRFRSCVSHVAGDSRQRHIRIRVNARTTDDRLMATIAHELQHAVEIVREPDVIDVRRTLALYRRIGTSRCRNGLTDDCETAAALAIEVAVLDELDRSPLRP